MLAGTRWLFVIFTVVLIDVIVTMLVMFIPAFDGTTSIIVLTWVILGVFIVDIVLRIAAQPGDFFVGSNRKLNIFELAIVIVCILFELVDSNAPVSMLRLTRPLLRLGRLGRATFRFIAITSGQAAQSAQSAPMS